MGVIDTKFHKLLDRLDIPEDAKSEIREFAREADLLILDSFIGAKTAEAAASDMLKGINQIAGVLKMSRATATKLVRDGTIKTQMIGKTHYASRRKLLAQFGL